MLSLKKDEEPICDWWVSFYLIYFYIFSAIFILFWFVLLQDKTKLTCNLLFGLIDQFGLLKDDSILYLSFFLTAPWLDATYLEARIMPQDCSFDVKCKEMYQQFHTNVSLTEITQQTTHKKLQTHVSKRCAYEEAQYWNLYLHEQRLWVSKANCEPMCVKRGVLMRKDNIAMDYFCKEPDHN